MKHRLWFPIFLAYVIFGGLLIAVTAGILQGEVFTDEAARRVWTLVAILYLLSFVILVLTVLFIFWPLRKLRGQAMAFDRGDFADAAVTNRRDEIGSIANTMNYMAIALDAFEENQRKFISNVSHDFRSPLTSIKGYAQAMADGVIPPEQQKKYLDIIIFETDRLEKLTENLLDLNRYGSKGVLLDRTSFDINELIRRTAESFEGQCREKNIQLQTDFQYEQIYVRADASKMDQVLHNLIDNAVKFSDSDSRVEIETRVKNEKVFVSVRDYGIGIPKESLGKIWDRFYKTDLSRGKDKKGTGLGLSIVREIIHAHQENINVISTQGVGTEFIFTLPFSGVELRQEKGE